MDKNFLISILTEVIEQSKGDWGRNQYLLKRIKQNKEIINSDKLYLERISGLKIPEIIDKTDNQYQQIPKKEKSVSQISDLVKCTTCNKEIKMDEKSTRRRNFWYHETCYKTISKNKYDQEKSDKIILDAPKVELVEIPKVEPVEIPKAPNAGFFTRKFERQKKQT